jgi:hypothetical protein
MELVPIRGIRLRRAVLGTLLNAERAMTVDEIVTSLHAHGLTTMPGLTRRPNRVIADLLAHQARMGRVRKVRRATFAVVPGAVSASTRSRWRRGTDGMTEGAIR